MLRWFCCFALVVGCKQTNDESCELLANRDKPECSGVDAPEQCTPACTGGQVCSGGNCVECVNDDQCVGNANGSVCTDNTCGPCTATAQCPSTVCDFDTGACVAEEDVLYVAKGGTGSDCARSIPCPTITAALAARTPTRNNIKIVGTDAVADDQVTDLNNVTVRIFADPGGTVTRSTPGEIFNMKGTANVAIFDLQIRDGTTATAHAIHVEASAQARLERVVLVNNDGAGVFSTSSGKLTMHRCVVTTNDLGGVDASNGPIEMSNNLIVANGGTTAQVGGVRLSPTAATFEFNTVADNVIVQINSDRGGINCVSNFAATATIITGNKLGPGCTMFDHSLFDVPPPAGNKNLMGNPDFLDRDPAHATFAMFYRIGGASSAIDKAETAGTVTTDIDGDSRSKGAGKDIGADEAN